MSLSPAAQVVSCAWPRPDAQRAKLLELLKGGKEYLNCVDVKERPMVAYIPNSRIARIARCEVCSTEQGIIFIAACGAQWVDAVSLFLLVHQLPLCLVCIVLSSRQTVLNKLVGEHLVLAAVYGEISDREAAAANPDTRLAEMSLHDIAHDRTRVGLTGRNGCKHRHAPYVPVPSIPHSAGALLFHLHWRRSCPCTAAVKRRRCIRIVRRARRHWTGSRPSRRTRSWSPRAARMLLIRNRNRAPTVPAACSQHQSGQRGWRHCWRRTLNGTEVAEEMESDAVA